MGTETINIWRIIRNTIRGIFTISWERKSEVHDLDKISDSRKRWLLAICAPFVENMIEPGYQDVLGIIPDGPESERKLKQLAVYHVELEPDFYDFEGRWKDVFGSPVSEELDISYWFQFPKDRRVEAAKLARKDKEEIESAELWNYLNKSKLDHAGSDFRLQMLTRIMYVQRLRYRVGRCTEEECWQSLELLGKAIERRLGGVTSWKDFAQRLLASFSVADMEDDPSDWRGALEKLLTSKASIWSLVPFESGLEIASGRAVRIFSNEPASNYSSVDAEERRQIISLLKKGKLVEAVNKIGEFTDNLSDDEKFVGMLGLITLNNVNPGQMKDLPEKCDNQIVGLMVRANWYVDWAWAAWGAYNASGNQFEEGLMWAWKDVERLRAEEVDTPRLIALSLNIVDRLNEEQCGFDPKNEETLLLEDLRARFPGYYPAMSSWLFYHGPNWMVEFDKAFLDAKNAVELAPEGSMLPLVLFEVALEGLGDLEPGGDDEDEDEDEDEDDYVYDSDEEKELEKARQDFYQRADVKQTLDSWVRPLLASMTPQTEYEILSTLSLWYYESKDAEYQELISDAMPERVLFDGSDWDEDYQRDLVVAALTWLYHR